MQNIFRASGSKWNYWVNKVSPNLLFAREKKYFFFRLIFTQQKRVIQDFCMPYKYENMSSIFPLLWKGSIYSKKSHWAMFTLKTKKKGRSVSLRIATAECVSCAAKPASTGVSERETRKIVYHLTRKVSPSRRNGGAIALERDGIPRRLPISLSMHHAASPRCIYPSGRASCALPMHSAYGALVHTGRMHLSAGVWGSTYVRVTLARTRPRSIPRYIFRTRPPRENTFSVREFRSMENARISSQLLSLPHFSSGDKKFSARDGERRSRRPPREFTSRRH